MSKRWILITMASAALFLGRAAPAEEEGGIALEHAHTDISNTASLQRGARNFMNYCSGCHSLKYLRYNRMAADLKIPESRTRQFDVHHGQGLRDRQFGHAQGLRETGSASSRPTCR